MFKPLVTALAVGWASNASAQSCPDFFRFVDFGLEDQLGTFSRGGPLLRAESLEGTPLLLRDRTECRTVRDIASDGHGNPIPVVTRVYYNPEKTGLGLKALQVSLAEDTKAATEHSAQRHYTRLDQAQTEITRGDNFLCAHAKDDSSISCQLVSPYPGNLALVVYCDAVDCTMPALALSDRMQVSASWSMPDQVLRNPEKVGYEMSERIQGIHDFLEPLM